MTSSLFAPQPASAPVVAKPLRVFKYRRISSDPSGMRFGVGTQNEEIDRYTAMRGWELVGEFEDNDASAYSLSKPRPAFNEMMRRAERGECDVIMARHMDRLTRRLEEFANIQRRATDAGFVIVTTADGVDTSTDGGRMMAGMLAVMAEAEMERKKYRQVTANKRRAETGKGWGARAFGYNGDHANPELVLDEAAAIREAYHSTLAGETLYSIAKRWNATGFRTGSHGNEFNAVAVRRVLLNPRNAGLRTYRGEVIYHEGQVVKGDWPVIVDEDTWQAVHYLLDQRRKPKSTARKYLLGSILTCGLCDKPLRSGQKALRSKHRGGATTPEDQAIYRCVTIGCSGVARRQRMIDPWVENTILLRIQEKGWKLVSGIDPELVESLHTEATVLRARMEELGVAFATGELKGAQVKVATETIEAKLNEVEGRLAKVAQSEVFDGLVGSDDLLAKWEDLGLDRKRAVITTLVDRIEVYPLNVSGWAARKLPMGSGLKVRWRDPEEC